MMSEKEMKAGLLPDDQLGDVTGGLGMNGGRYQFIGPVEQGSAVVGKDYYVVAKEAWFYGTLLKVENQDIVRGSARRTLEFHITLTNGQARNVNMTFTGDTVTLYANAVVSC